MQSWTPDLKIDNHLFHRYNTFTIINDFRNALCSSYNEKLIRKVKSDKWVDYSAGSSSQSKEELSKLRNKVIGIHRNVSKADVLIITPGLVEAWYDKEVGAYLNNAPIEDFIKNPERYELRITNYRENLKDLEEFRTFLHNKVGEHLKIIGTVSPVPFVATYSGDDVIVANSYSKSTLRAVAQDLASKYEDIDYFPSYEIVTLSDPNISYLPDYRHVNAEIVDQIMNLFIDKYIS